MPSINPDGTQMIADWYMKYVGTEYEASGLPWLYQKYAGHDNNRDGFALNLPESQHLGKLMYRDWIPQAYVDHHQMGSGNARLYIPPYAEPIRPDADPLVWREMSWWGAHMGNRLEAAGKTGVIGAAIYSGWGHMGFHWITPFHNIAGMLTESASARLATPMFLHPDQLRGGRAASRSTSPRPRCRACGRAAGGASATSSSSRRSPRGPRWTWRRATARPCCGNMYLKASRQTERGANGRQGLRDSRGAARSAHGQEAGQHAARLRRRGAPGEGPVHRGRPRVRSGLVRRLDGAAQAGARAVDARAHLLSRQHPHARRRGQPDSPLRHVHRHVGEFMGVRTEPLGEKVSADLVRLTAPVPLVGTAAASAPNGYVLDGRLNDSVRAVNQLLARGIAVSRATRPSDDGSVRPGDFLVGPGDVTAVAKAAGVDFVALKAPLTSGVYQIRKPRIAMFQRYNGGNMDEGWTRLMFEQFDVPYTSLMDEELKKGGLEASYDVIVLPADSVFGDDRGSAPSGPGRAWRRLRWRPDARAARVPQRIRRRGRQGPRGVRAEGRHAGHLRAGRRPADPAVRPAAQQRRREPARQGVLVAGLDPARAIRELPSAGLRHAGRGAGALHGRVARFTRSPQPIAART
jgi:hypothetical protein